MLRRPWSDRFAARGRPRNPGSTADDPSRNKAEVTLKSDDRLRLGGAEADFATNRVRAPDGTVTTLRRQTAAVLRALAARRGRNASKAELFAEVWGDIAVTDDSLTQCVTEIRRALGSARGVLVTVARDGYRLEAEAALPEAGRGARWRVAAGAGLLVLIVAGGAGALWPGRTGPISPQSRCCSSRTSRAGHDGSGWGGGSRPRSGRIWRGARESW